MKLPKSISDMFYSHRSLSFILVPMLSVLTVIQGQIMNFPLIIAGGFCLVGSIFIARDFREPNSSQIGFLTIFINRVFKTDFRTVYVLHNLWALFFYIPLFYYADVSWLRYDGWYILGFCLLVFFVMKLWFRRFESRIFVLEVLGYLLTQAFILF